MDIKEDLVVWKESFFTDNFNVDHCLSTYTQKSDLETLRKELKNYGTELQQQMSEILKAETEAIVNLAEYLTNLNSKIENLSGPVSQLREEIMTLYNLIKYAEDSYAVMLRDVKNNNTKRNHIHLKLDIISSSIYIKGLMESSANFLVDIDLLERLVNKYSFQRTYLDELRIMSSDTEEIVMKLESQLIEIIDKKFLESFENEDTKILTTCLRMYDNLQKQDQAHETFRINVVRPFLQKLCTHNNLEKNQQNLDKIYEELLFFMDKRMSILFDIISDNQELKSFNFILYSFWKEFDRQSQDGLPNITAPGNPELFQKRFKSTWNFLSRIASKCSDKNLLRDNDTFQNHVKRFNLPVYFEIRYQQIAGRFENEILIETSQMFAPANDLSCKLKHTLALWTAIARCFHKDVYIDQLADQFIKLSMMLLSRYLGWFLTTLNDNLALESEQIWEKYLMDALVDLSIVENFIAPNINNLFDINTTLFSVINHNLNSVMIRVFASNRKSIDKVRTKLKDHLINIEFERSSVHLQNVGAIPRLYRRTNRGAPKEASTYMFEAIKPILNFHNEFNVLLEKQSKDILESVIGKVTDQYLSLVQEVLRSVCKTEESLRKLKSRSINSNEESSTQTDTMSDEMKIREQIKYDVAYFLDKLYPLGSSASRETMDLLKKETN